MPGGPLALIAELTHRCPLHCVYCSNPLEMRTRAEELSTVAWTRIFAEAAQAGVLQLHLTGGEPLARADLADLVRTGRQSGLYVNLITSGLGLNEERMAALVEAGLDHVQLSMQDSSEESANEFAGARAHAHKLRAAALIRRHPVAFTLNLVVHRRNLDRLEASIALAEQLAADRLEIANVQYYGWALTNRAALLPSREQLDRSIGVVEAARERLKGRMRIEFVVPDYYSRFPKPCMGGWARTLMLVDPSGRAMPCHAAGVIPGMRFDSLAERPLEWVWNESESFRRFRGEDWMAEPCRNCDRRAIDFGGCRCQAFLLAGDASATDPVCSLSPARPLVDRILASIEPASSEFVYRIDPA